MDATAYAVKLKREMDTLLQAMADPGFDNFVSYREAVGRFHGLKTAMEHLKLTIEEDEKAT